MPYFDLYRLLTCKVRFPFFMSTDARALLSNLLQGDTTKRFGNMRNGVADIQSHAWFASIDWINVLDRKVRKTIFQLRPTDKLLSSIHLGTAAQKCLIFSKVKPPYIPHVKDDADATNFDDYPEEVMLDPYEFSSKTFFEEEFADF